MICGPKSCGWYFGTLFCAGACSFGFSYIVSKEMIPFIRITLQSYFIDSARDDKSATLHLLIFFTF